MKIKIKLWWPGYDPTDIFEDYAHRDGRDFEVDDGKGWRLPRAGATIGVVADWIEDYGKSIAVHLLRSGRQGGRWHGLYLLEIE